MIFESSGFCALFVSVSVFILAFVNLLCFRFRNVISCCYCKNATSKSLSIPGDDNNVHFLHLLRQITSGYPKSNCREECRVRPANDGSYCLIGNSILPVS